MQRGVTTTTTLLEDDARHEAPLGRRVDLRERESIYEEWGVEREIEMEGGG